MPTSKHTRTAPAVPKDSPKTASRIASKTALKAAPSQTRKPAARPAADAAVRPRKAAARNGGVIDLDHYVPAYLTWVANKMSRGASQYYLALFGVGIEVWRCLVLLAVHGSITAQAVSRVIGMDKGTVSRCFKTMQEQKLIRTELHPDDGRVRVAVLTDKGRELHDLIREVALERERTLLSVLSPQESETLLDLLRRLHENLPAVEAATQQFVDRRHPELAAAARRRPRKEEDAP